MAHQPTQHRKNKGSKKSKKVKNGANGTGEGAVEPTANVAGHRQQRLQISGGVGWLWRANVQSGLSNHFPISVYYRRIFHQKRLNYLAIPDEGGLIGFGVVNSVGSTAQPAMPCHRKG
jgi:hypothetical protein